RELVGRRQRLGERPRRDRPPDRGPPRSRQRGREGEPGAAPAPARGARGSAGPDGRVRAARERAPRRRLGDSGDGLLMTFLSPLGGLVALLVVAPLAAAVVAYRRAAQGRRLIGLAPPPRGHNAVLPALAAVPLLLGLAAAQP